jgi:hypothetical protein
MENIKIFLSLTWKWKIYYSFEFFDFLQDSSEKTRVILIIELLDGFDLLVVTGS